jgi:hypothetical protein
MSSQLRISQYDSTPMNYYLLIKQKSLSLTHSCNHADAFPSIPPVACSYSYLNSASIVPTLFRLDFFPIVPSLSLPRSRSFPSSRLWCCPSCLPDSQLPSVLRSPDHHGFIKLPHSHSHCLYSPSPPHSQRSATSC